MMDNIIEEMENLSFLIYQLEEESIFYEEGNLQLYVSRLKDSYEKANLLIENLEIDLKQRGEEYERK